MTHQVLVRSGGHAEAIGERAGRRRTAQVIRTFGGKFKAGGWEVVRAMDLEAHAERVRDEAIALCHADVCPDGLRTLILGGAQLALQIHESVGHPLELDRLLGCERDLAGGSFATTEQLGHPPVRVERGHPRGGLDRAGWAGQPWVGR